MSDCDRARALIDSDSPDDQAEKALTTHLDDCAECRAYKALADASAEALGLWRRDLTARSPALAFEALRTRAARERRTTLTGILGTVVSLLAALWFLRRGWQPGILILSAWAVGSAAVAWWSSRPSPGSRCPSAPCSHW